ncbi:MAG: Ig-like domain-containing protein, partial [Butyrivibrio sp.]|nr:Ig-like domain-containing protein [Butyrivibrio sp.]
MNTEISFPEGFEGMTDDAPVSNSDDSSDSDEEISLMADNLSDDDVFVQVTGTYYTLSAETILKQINQIRYEACKEGLELNGTALTLDDYVPLKWSSNIEASARKRAMEAGLSLYHYTLSQNVAIWDYLDKSKTSGFCTYAENIAWNNNHDSSGITYGINQFYEEKEAYIAYLKDGQYHGQTGHYTSMINPKYEYVGVSACLMPGTVYGWITIAMQLGGAFSGATIDETKDSSTGKISNILACSKSNLNTFSVSGSSKIGKGETGDYSISGKLELTTRYGSITDSYKIPAGIGSGVTWESSDETIASVSDGSVTGLKGGEVTITASAGTASANKSVTITNPITGISLSSAELNNGNILDGKTINIVREETGSGTLEVTYAPEDCTDTKKATFKSSNTSVVTVDSKGVFTVKKPGTATITATTETSSVVNPTVTSEFTLNVSSPLTAISLNKSSATLNYTGSKASTVKLSVSFTPADTDDDKTVTWSSSDTSIVTVDDSGLVTAVAGGSATITAKVGTFAATCDVIVNAPVKAIDLSETEKRLFTNEASSTLTVELTPLYTSEKEVVFTSSDISVFTVSDGSGTCDETVTITAKDGSATATLNRVTSSNETAQLTVETANGKYKKTIDVVIAKPTTSIELYLDGNIVNSGSSLDTNVGYNAEISAVTSPSDAYDSSVEFTSSDEEVAIVAQKDDTTAMLLIVGEGKATITATSYNASTPIESSFTVNSTFEVNKVSLDRTSIELTIGDNTYLMASANPYIEGAMFTYSSSDTTVATVDEKGNIKATGAGIATITVTCQNASATCEVCVSESGIPDDDEPLEGDDETGIWVLKSSFYDSVPYTGSKITQDNMTVYYNNKMLTEKTDYTLSYKNNLNAADASSAKAPQVTVKLKGQYSGSRTYSFSITAIDISNNDEDEELVTENGEKTVSYNGKDQKIVPELYYEGTKLKKGKDFNCEYADADYSSVGAHTVTVTGTGNYTGTRTVTYYITEPDKNLSKASVTVKPADATAKKIYYGDGISEEDINVTVKIGKNEVDSSYF